MSQVCFKKVFGWFFSILPTCNHENMHENMYVKVDQIQYFKQVSIL